MYFAICSYLSRITLHAALLRRAAAIVRNGRLVRDRAHLDAHGLDCADSGLSAGSRSFDDQVHFLDTDRLGCLDCLLSSQASRKGRALARTFETSRSRAAPGQGIALRI